MPLIRFQAVIQQFENQGEKTGWTYVPIPAEWAEKLKPDNRRSFRVKGKLDNFPIKAVSLLPMGGGDFIMALNSAMRKGIGKRVGTMLALTLEEDHSEFEIPADLIEWLDEVPAAKDFFEKLPKSHQRYWVNWLAGVKSETARQNRLERAVNSLSQGFGFAEMLRAEKANRLSRDVVETLRASLYPRRSAGFAIQRKMVPALVRVLTNQPRASATVPGFVASGRAPRRFRVN